MPAERFAIPKDRDDPRLPDVKPFVPEQEQMQNEPDALASLAAIGRRTAEGDTDRIRSAAQLVNTFNFAVQVQAKRAHWLPSDFRAFAIALAALDSVGSIENELRDTLTTYSSGRSE